MSEAAEFIADLDEELRDRGQTVTLRRTVTNGAPLEISVPAIISGYELEELVGDIVQTDQRMILSPTGQTGPFASAPIRRDDVALFEGRKHTVASVDPVYIGGSVIRYNCRVSG